MQVMGAATILFVLSMLIPAAEHFHRKRRRLEKAFENIRQEREIQRFETLASECAVINGELCAPDRTYLTPAIKNAADAFTTL
jgi:hypothetical protein